ncbi:MAG: tetratricopeptide repeat protein [Muribaculaceae bacterium]|nr:tetratricopeptide repeat protein [Muribaculaceae bacterium]
MAKKQNQSARTTLEEVNESLTSAAQRIEDNKKYINWALIGIAILALLAGGYIWLHNKNVQEAKEKIGEADIELLQAQDDPAKLDKVLKDYEKVAEDFGNKAGERAHINAAILLYQKGEYEKAAKHLEEFSPAGNLIGPATQSLLGDCYVNLKKLDKAISAYDKAISLAGDNEAYAPAFMLKKATVLHSQKKYAEEAAIYQTIKDKYTTYGQQNGFNIDKYLERANALAGK